jgi:tetratricopeptide (TPR) repeat protein
MCDFIVERWGNDAILGMVRSFAAHKTTEDAILDNLHISPEQFDNDFQAWLNKQTEPVVKQFAEWKKNMEGAHASLRAGKLDDAIQNATRALSAYPDFVQGGSAYDVLAKAYSDKKDDAKAAAILEQYRDRGGRNPALLKQLAGLQEKAGLAAKAVDTYRCLLDIYLEDEEVHRKFGALELAGNRPDAAIREFQAVLALEPSDVAQSHYDLARAFAAAQRKENARDEVLLALEAAPGFKPAQQLLLQLNK